MNAKYHIKKLFYTLGGSLLIIFGVVTANAQSTTNEVKREWGQEIQGYSISISTSKNVFAPAEPISMTITLKNIGKESLWLVRGNTFLFYNVNVLLPDKKPAPQTLYGARRIGNASGIAGVASYYLKPGEETSTEIPLSRLFDFSLAGTYEISVIRKIKIQKDNQWLDVPSNQIEVTVDEHLSPKP
jgi:hypothetical protein